MANKIFQGLAKEKIELFKRAFTESKELFWDESKSELIHPGEFGIYREAIVKDFLSIFIPSRYSIGSGFIISTNGRISTQCDLVIFDHQSTPLMQSINHQIFYPIETVVAIGEIKSDINSKAKLTEALVKLSKIKEMREEIRENIFIKHEIEGDYDPIHNPFDQIFTFLICNKLGFEINVTDGHVDDLYPDEILSRHKHNIVFSITDGILTYHNGECNYYYPVTYEINENEKLIKPDNMEIDSHFLHLIAGLVMGIKFATILSPDMAMYLSDDLFSTTDRE
jgi:hypothetical protein